MIKVLLVSPIDPNVPGNLKFLVGGENTYSRALLANPPAKVSYIHFQKALEDRQIEYTSLQYILKFLVKFRILPLSSGSQCLRIRGKFDLIHCHSYSIKIDKRVPIVLSDSSSNYLFLRDYVNWPEWRIRAGYSLRQFLFKKLGIVDPDTNLRGVKKLIVFSKFSARIHQELGAAKDKIGIIYPGLPLQKTNRRKNIKTVNILFVGTWFERKGGSLLLEAFKNLSGKYSNIRLTIVGEVPKNVKCQMSNVKCLDFVPREKLLKEYFANADILVLVPPQAEGFGFVVLEAMSFGIPAIVSRIYALAEIVRDGKTGFVIKPGSVEELASRLEILIKDQTLRRKMGEAAKKMFLEKFSIKKSTEALLKVYKEAMGKKYSQALTEKSTN